MAKRKLPDTIFHVTFPTRGEYGQAVQAYLELKPRNFVSMDSDTITLKTLGYTELQAIPGILKQAGYGYLCKDNLDEYERDGVQARNMGPARPATMKKPERRPFLEEMRFELSHVLAQKRSADPDNTIPYLTLRDEELARLSSMRPGQIGAIYRAYFDRDGKRRKHKPQEPPLH